MHTGNIQYLARLANARFIARSTADSVDIVDAITVDVQQLATQITCDLDVELDRAVLWNRDYDRALELSAPGYWRAELLKVRRDVVELQLLALNRLDAALLKAYDHKRTMSERLVTLGSAHEIVVEILELTAEY